MEYDLEKRTSTFGQSVILFLKKVPLNIITKPLISQLIRSATSIGANYREANEACSKKDFRNKIAISKKEANETRHWLKMINTACPELTAEADVLLKEARELLLILGAIYTKLKN